MEKRCIYCRALAPPNSSPDEETAPTVGEKVSLELASRGQDDAGGGWNFLGAHHVLHLDRGQTPRQGDWFALWASKVSKRGELIMFVSLHVP